MILDHITTFKKSKSKFEYLHSKTCFDERIYDELNRTFPELDEEKSIQSNNNRYDMNLKYIDHHNIILSNIWKEFIDQCISMTFFNQICDTFNIDKRVYKSISRRGYDDNSDIKVDFQFAYNIKNKDKHETFLRKPHVDEKDKMIVILLYFPSIKTKYRKGDFGNLLLYEGTSCNNLKVIGEIPYEHNNGIIFKNSKHAIHAPLTLINHENENRRFINVIYINNNKNDS
jgi:hypothetical protein